MSDMSSHTRITRREFVQTGTGLVIGFYLPRRLGAALRPAEAAFAPNAWLRVGTDGIVTLTVDKSEMGQGSQTGLAMILAEELDADWATVRLGPVPENPAGWSRRMSTGGSTAIRTSWEPLRTADAAARHSGQSGRQRRVRDRRHGARNAHRVDRALPGIRGDAEAVRRGQGGGAPGRARRGGARAQCVDRDGRRLGGRVRRRRRGG